MRLIRLLTSGSPDPCLGVVVRDQAVPCAVLQSKAGKPRPYLADSRSYLANLPDSQRAAKELLIWAEQHFGEYGQVKYQGSTSEISHKAEDVFAWRPSKLYV